MKHLLALFALHFSFTTLHAAVPLRWTVETSAANPATFDQFAGATYDLEAALQNRGKPLAVSGEAQLFWQTNGMGSAWWTAPATVSGNVLRATWTPACDVGARVYNCFIGITGTVYNAAFQLRLRPSPGAHPNDLPLPTPVIDFSRVTVLNPPWSGGGGSGVDTNAVRDIVRKTVDGAARMLPKYLWCMDFDDSYTNDAAWYYAQPQDYGSCSAVRDGGFLYRNLDWKFSDAADVVVRMSAGPGRFASVGVANCGTNLTEETVASGKPSRYFKCLPGRTVDGVNENGVCVEVNVVGGDPADRWDNPDGDIHPLAAVRWVLDNATSAGMAASNLASRIAFPPVWSQNFHWMVADSSQTWIVENGECSNVTGRAVMTNFPLLPTPTYGPGWERYMLLQDSFANITNAWFTRAYSHETEWVSEFHGTTEMDDAKELWNNGNGKESHRGQHDGNVWWWQTVHTSTYDLTNRTLRICVQEQDDWYVFQVPPSGGGSGGTNADDVKAIVDAEVGGTNAVKAAVADVAAIKYNYVKDGQRTVTFRSDNDIGAYGSVSIHTDDGGGMSIGDADASINLQSSGGNEVNLSTGYNGAPGRLTITGYNDALFRIGGSRDEPDKGIVGVFDVSNSKSTLKIDGVDVALKGDAEDVFKANANPTNNVFSNAVVTVARELTPPALPYMRQYDSVLHCWWIGRMVNGVIEWEVE